MAFCARRWSVLRRVVLVAALLFPVLAGGSAGAQSLRSKADFTEDVAGVFQKAIPGATVTVLGPLVLKMSLPGGSVDTVGLERIWKFCRANRDNCAALVASYVEDMTAGQHEANKPIVPAMLRVVVRSAQYVESGSRAFGDEPDMALAAKPLAGDLWVLCVADKSHTTETLRRRDLAKLGLSLDGAIALGIKNLRADLPPLHERWHGVPPRRLGVLFGEGYYEASRILLHDDWAETAKEMDGHLIVVAPATDLVFYASDATPDAVGFLGKAAVEAAKSQDRPISPTVLRWTPAGWEEAKPPSGAAPPSVRR